MADLRTNKVAQALFIKFVSGMNIIFKDGRSGAAAKLHIMGFLSRVVRVDDWQQAPTSQIFACVKEKAWSGYGITGRTGRSC